jgi:hypothetical protein
LPSTVSGSRCAGPDDAIRFLGGLGYVAAVTLVAAGIFFALRSVTRVAAPVVAAGE